MVQKGRNARNGVGVCHIMGLSKEWVVGATRRRGVEAGFQGGDAGDGIEVMITGGHK